MEFVFSLTSTTLNPQIPDAPPGIGTTKSVSLAPKTGSSMLIEFASQFLINVKLTLRTETALPAMKAMTLRKVNVFSLISITLVLLIWDVPPGIGKIKFA